MDQQKPGAYRAHKRTSGNYRPPTCEDATATDMSDSQPERPTRQHHRDGAEARSPLQPTTANVPSSSRFPGQATGQPTYQPSGYTSHPFAPVQSTYNPNPLYGGSAVPMSYPSTYQAPSYSGRYASNTSVPYTYPGQYAQPPYIYPPTTQPSVGYDDPRRYSYGDDYYQPEPTNTYPSRPPPPAPRPPRASYGYGHVQRSATPAPKTERPPPPKKKVPPRPSTARPAEDNARQDKLVKEIGKMRRQIKKLEMGQEDLLSDTGRVRSEFMLPSASLAGRASSVESVQTLEHIRRIIDDCLRKTGRESSYYGDSGVGAIEALIRDKLASERRESMEPKDDRSFRRRVIEVLQDLETQDGRWERRSTTGGSTTREEKRRSGGQRSTTSSDPPLEPVTPPSNYSMPQRAGKASSVSPEDGRSRDVEYIYETRPRGTSRAVHSDEETISRPPITRRPEAGYQGGTGRARRRSMVEPERGSYGRPRVYHGTEEVVDDYEDDRPQRRRTVVYPDRRSTPYSGGGLGQRFRTDPTSAPSSSTRWSREGGVYDAR